MSVRCTNGTAFTVALDAGTTSGGTLAQRLMSNGSGSKVQYNLYTDSADTHIWGDGNGGTQGAVPATE